MSGLLEAVRVVEIGSAITAPLAGMMLADMGADVIKVEPPGGDQFRGGDAGGYGATFIAYNRNKRSVIIDLATAAGRAELHRLVDDCDVLLDNFRPGVLERLDLAPDDLRRRNPGLLHCSITGFGTVGPYRTRPAFDAVGQALSGVASLFVDPEEPQPAGPTISDNVTGMYACTAILAALVERGRSGRGRRLEVNMLEASMAFMPDAFINYTRNQMLYRPTTRVTRSQVYIFRCADGRLLSIQLSTSNKFWLALTKALDLPECAAAERFATHAGRIEHYEVLREIMAQRFLTRSRDDWAATLTECDVPFAPVLTIAEALDDAQVQALGSVVAVDHPTQGRVTGIQCPVLVDGERPRSRITPPPTAGEHTAAILDAPAVPWIARRSS